MKRKLLGIIVCPICRGALKLSVEEENDTKIVSGSLYCPKCNVNYPIEDTIPNLLPPGLH